MFRKTALLFVAFLCAADATKNYNKNYNKTSNKIPKSTIPKDKTNLRKVSGFALCTKPYEAYVGGPNVAGAGAFSYPVYPGDCTEVTGETRQIGSLSATCSGNPYEGVYTTFNRVSSTEGFTAQPLGQVGPCDNATGDDCVYDATDAPQFQDGSILPAGDVVPFDTTAAELQEIVDNFCALAEADYETKASQCSAELRLSGNDKRSKHHGSILSFDYNTITTLESAGGTYTTETQYGLGGTAFDGTAAGAIYQVALNAYVVVTSVTCLYRPISIDSDFQKIYGGGGRFEKFAASKVDSVEQFNVLDSSPADTPIANPTNAYQTSPQFWNTQLEVNYMKPYFHSSML